MTLLELTAGRHLIASLRKDADLLAEIRRIVSEECLDAALFSAIGAVQDAQIAYYGQQSMAYTSLSFSEPMEMVSCLGNVAFREDEKDPVVHAHAVFGKRDGSLVGGHVVSATLFACEMHLRSVEERLLRVFDAATGLHLISGATRQGP